MLLLKGVILFCPPSGTRYVHRSGGHFLLLSNKDRREKPPFFRDNHTLRKALLIRRNPDDFGNWEGPGGAVEENETLEDPIQDKQSVVEMAYSDIESLNGYFQDARTCNIFLKKLQEIAKSMIDRLPDDKMIFVINMLEGLGEMSGLDIYSAFTTI